MRYWDLRFRGAGVRRDILKIRRCRWRAAEFAMVMLHYLKGALNRRLELAGLLNEVTLLVAIREGTVLRV